MVKEEPRVHCPCITCSKCGVWIVAIDRVVADQSHETGKMRCPECGERFDFEADRARVYPLRQSVYERGYFYPSEMRES